MVHRGKRIALWWSKAGIGTRLFLFLLCSTLLGFLVYWQRPSDERVYQGSYLQIYLLVNFLIIILCILAFLVGRNVVKLIFDRRRNILGSHLRLRLVAAFVGITLIPTSILFVLSSGLLTTAFGDLFGQEIDSTVQSAVNLGRRHFKLLEEEASDSTMRAVKSINGVDPTIEPHIVLEEMRSNFKAYSIRLVGSTGELIAESVSAASALDSFEEPAVNLKAITRAEQGKVDVQLEERGANRFFRGYAGVLWRGQPAVIVITISVDPEVTHAGNVIRDFFSEYEQLKLFRNQLRSGNVLTLLMLTALLLFAAIWFGFYLAREITGPIQRLAEGTQAIARGDYNVHIRGAADDELGYLVKSFNTMASDLRLSRSDAEKQRSYLEAVLANLMVGVIGVDPTGRITTINAAVSDLLELASRESVIGRFILDVVPDSLKDIISAVFEGGKISEIERTVSLLSKGRQIQLLVTSGLTLDAEGRKLGGVLIFDDITEISKAQQVVAWREVARRIAHEIKNPLTPIQLSAQRLEKAAQVLPQLETVKECTTAITENVSSIKRLLDEFLKFARMPQIEIREGDLNLLVADSVAPYVESNKGIVFHVISERSIPKLSFDHDQIRRVLINLMENAIRAIEESKPQEGGRIVVKTSFDQRRKMAVIEVNDNGPGVPEELKPRIFEPYFSTKSDGSGLGLAIVTSIVADHGGIIRVFDNSPHGAQFVVELPENLGSRGYSTSRRLR